MFTLIVNVNDADEVVGLIPKTGHVWMKKMSAEDAAFYRRRLVEEIMLGIYFDRIPGDIVGRYNRLEPFSTKESQGFCFEPV